MYQISQQRVQQLVTMQLQFSFCITPLYMNVSATIVWKRIAQPLPAEICDITEHLEDLLCHRRQ
jgi:hypothetical protein